MPGEGEAIERSQLSLRNEVDLVQLEQYLGYNQAVLNATRCTSRFREQCESLIRSMLVGVSLPLP